MRKVLFLVAVLVAVFATEGEAQTTCSAFVPKTQASQAEEIAEAQPAGATVCIERGGVYPITSLLGIDAEEGQTYTAYGAGERPILEGQGATRIIDLTDATNVTVRNLEITGSRGERACAPGCGHGVGGQGAFGLLMDNVYVHHNDNAGVSGSGTIQNTELAYNGEAWAFYDCGNNPCSASGVKAYGPMAFLNGSSHHNFGNGVWADDNAGRLVVRNSNLSENHRAGVHNEVNDGPAIIEGNTFVSNGQEDSVYSRRTGGVSVACSTNTDVTGNVFRGNKQAAVFGVNEPACKFRHAFYNLDVVGNTVYPDEPFLYQRNPDLIIPCAKAPDAEMDCRNNRRA